MGVRHVGSRGKTCYLQYSRRTELDTPANQYNVSADSLAHGAAGLGP
jgi:hypothetical protein